MSIQDTFLSGAKWTSVQQIVSVGLGIVRLAVLARLLEESTFGLFAVTLMLVGFTGLFADFGISTSLYHQKNISQVQYSTLYWLSLLFSGAFYVMLLTLIPVAIWYFEEPQLASIIPIMGINLFLASLGSHYKVYAEKALKFKEIAFVTICSSVLSLALSINLALSGFEIYALILPILLATFLASCSYLWMMYSKYPLQFTFQFGKVKAYFNIGLYQALSRLTDFIANQLDILLIGRLLGMETLGIYNLVKELLKRIYGLSNTIITKTSIPIFSSFNENEELLKNRFLKLVTAVAFLTSIMYGSFAYFGREILQIMYGARFSEYFEVFIMFCLIYCLNSFGTIAAVLVVSKGKTQYGLIWVLYRLVVTLLLMLVFGKFYGLHGVVFGLVVFAIITPITYYYMVIGKVQSNIGLKEYLSTFGKSLSTGLMIFIFASMISTVLPESLSIYLLILTKLIILTCVSLVVVLLFQREKIDLLLDLAKNSVAKN